MIGIQSESESISHVLVMPDGYLVISISEYLISGFQLSIYDNALMTKGLAYEHLVWTTSGVVPLS